MLKLDLLPAHYTIARRNRKIIYLAIPLLAGVLLLWLLVMVKMNSTIASTTTQLAETKAAADKVRTLQGETDAKKAELKPIQDKVDFVLAADKSGGQYWDAFYEVNKYVMDRALVTKFSLTPPDAVSFEVEVETTEDAGRFILNLIRCPAINSISISGSPVSGGTITGTSGASAPAAAGGGGAPGMPGGEMGPGMPGGAPGAPGAPPGGMPGGMAGAPPGGPGMPGPGAGAPGAPGGAPAAGGASAAGPIKFTVTAKLVKPLAVPTPPGAAAAAAAGGPGGPGGMPGGPGGPPGAGGGPPGAGGGPPGDMSPGGGKGGKAGKGGGDEEDGGGKAGKKGGGGGGDE